MTNQSIKNAFQRLWEHVVSLVDDKANKNDFIEHTSDLSNPHEVTAEQVGADPKGSADTALVNANLYADTVANSKYELSKNYIDEKISGIPDPSFIVTISGNDIDGYSADKSFVEIQEAYANNIVVLGVLNYSVNQLVAINDSNIVFGSLNEAWISIVIRNDNTISVFEQRTPLTLEENYGDLETENKSILGAINELQTNKVETTVLDQYATIEYTDECENRPKNNVIITDEINGCEYVLRMRGGRLITYCMLSSIAIKNYPDKVVYVDGEAFDPSGITLIATYQDGNTKEITSGFTVEHPETVHYGDNEIDITVTYTAYDVTCTFTGKHGLAKVYSQFELLISKDFEYTDNGDGTFTLLDWKETFNGEPSTECIIPDDANIIL